MADDKVEIKPAPRKRAAQVRSNRAPEQRMGFDAWFASKVGSKELSPGVRSALVAHMKAYGFFDKNEFDKGLKHFGA